MEVLVSKMQTSINLEKNEEKYNQHIFAKDEPRIVRYSVRYWHKIYSLINLGKRIFFIHLMYF